jgi:mono/diheme cytochrome c family protein
MKWLVSFWAVVLCLGLCSCGRGAAAGQPDEGAVLGFVKEGKPLHAFKKGELEAAIKPEIFTVFDPNYKKKKTFRALPLPAVLAQGFPGVALEHEDVVLRARDGFSVPVKGALLLEKGAYIAVEDLEQPSWEPVGPQRANPGPYYMIWREKGQEDVESHPWPWQLAAIEIARFESLYPHVSPPNVSPGSPAMTGFRVFRENCLSCHAINREGGHVGPDLNVPQSIVEYRPEEQIRAYIVNPLAFRYGKMPPHGHLGRAELDGLIAYFNVMKEHKYEPERMVR